MTMLEMLARAAEDALEGFADFGTVVDTAVFVRAVLLALREPNEQMLEVMRDACIETNWAGAWRAAIDHVLKGEE